MVTRGYIILNVIRVFSIIALVMTVIAAMATLVKSFILSRYFLFDVLNNIVLSIFCVLVFFSEIEYFPSYYERRWPLFGPNSSLVGVGVAEIIIGFQLLGNLNERNTSKENIGYSFNALLMAAGIIVGAVGVMSFLAPYYMQSYVYSCSQTHTTARTFRSRTQNSLDKESPVMVLEEVQVIGEPLKLERPQRAYSQSSERTLSGESMGKLSSAAFEASSERGIERSTSVASSRGPYPCATVKKLERSYSGPPAIATHERSYSAASGAPSSFYSQPSVVGYSVGGNPYSQPPRNPYA